MSPAWAIRTLSVLWCQQRYNSLYYPRSSLPIRGRSHETQNEGGGGRGARGRFRNPLPGGPGQAVRRHYRPAAFDGWTRRGRRAAEAARIGSPEGASSTPGSTAPGTEKAAHGAPRGERVRKTRPAPRKARDQAVAPCGAPFPRARPEGEDKEGRRAPRRKPGAAKRWLTRCGFIAPKPEGRRRAV